ncbi:MAG: LPS biosynthesis protein WbpP [Planctomycetota bacterium]|nr:MAG: LPS biosynthesis protein WbpP [Planctomycetota bacterium]
MTDFLVTGGAGFIGSHIVQRLVEQGRRVRVLDNFATGRRENLTEVAGRIELIEGDMADPQIAQRACQGVDVVLHQAAIPSVPKSVADPATSHRANVEGTFQLLVAAREAGVRRFVYAGSSSAYGESKTLPKVETMATDPLSPYAVQKLTGEYYCRAFARCYGMQTLTMRYFNVFGPRQDPKSQYAAAIPAFVTSILRSQPPTVYGDGEQTRDFTYIENVVEANLLAATAPRTAGEVINVACGGHVTVNEIIRDINKLLGKDIQPSYVPARNGDIRHSWADISLAEKVIGYRPKVTFAEGLQRAINWYARNLSV